jgi:multidrug efflux pump subunit AcrA (membrane-fusion protein)
VTRTKWVWLFTGLVAAGLLAVALWYARERGWLGIAQTKEEQGHGSMSMDMGGSDDDESEISGYSAVTIEPGLQQRIGVTVEEVTKQPLEMSVRTVGIVRPNETKMARIHLRTEGWVEELFVNFTGQEIQKGDPLLSIYSPEFLTTQQDYLTARKAERTTDVATRKARLQVAPCAACNFGEYLARKSTNWSGPVSLARH